MKNWLVQFKLSLLPWARRGVKGDRSYDGQIARRATNRSLRKHKTSFVSRWGFRRLIVEGLASALGRLIEDPDLRRRPGEDGTALHRTRLDIEVRTERFVATWTESVRAGER
jgi:hypothetical protein